MVRIRWWLLLLAIILTCLVDIALATCVYYAWQEQ